MGDKWQWKRLNKLAASVSASLTTSGRPSLRTTRFLKIIAFLMRSDFNKAQRYRKAACRRTLIHNKATFADKFASLSLRPWLLLRSPISALSQLICAQGGSRQVTSGSYCTHSLVLWNGQKVQFNRLHLTKGGRNLCLWSILLPFSKLDNCHCLNRWFV